MARSLSARNDSVLLKRSNVSEGDFKNELLTTASFVRCSSSSNRVFSLCTSTHVAFEQAANVQIYNIVDPTRV